MAFIKNKIRPLFSILDLLEPKIEKTEVPRPKAEKVFMVIGTKDGKNYSHTGATESTVDRWVKNIESSGQIAVVYSIMEYYEKYKEIALQDL